MATKKRDSIQEERIQSVTAPRAEPGAANMTIPRRDLLTGAAMVLVASASGCGNGTQNSGNANPKPLRTDFMKNFTATFIGDPTKIKDPAPPPAADPWPDNPPAPSTRVWPKLGQTLNDAVTDFATFANVLLTVGVVGAPPPTFTSGTLGYRIVQFLNTHHWPSAAGVPPEYQMELPTVYLVEIAVIQDRLLQAINSFDFTGHGTGGVGSNWPPH
jgi:hypothetical protein